MTSQNLKDEALTAATEQRWKDAIHINESILKETPDDCDALNRLAFAHCQSGNIPTAIKTYKHVITLDPYNLIAQKNIDRLKSCPSKKHSQPSAVHSSMSTERFLEEPGKTKIVECVNVAPTASIAQLHYGEELLFKPKKHGVEIRTTDNTYVGALPDDMAFRINRLISAGNTYSVHVKGITKNCISVFIRELSRAKEFKNQPSFIGKTSYIPYSHDDGGEKPDVAETGSDASDDAA